MQKETAILKQGRHRADSWGFLNNREIYFSTSEIQCGSEDSGNWGYHKNLEKSRAWVRHQLFKALLWCEQQLCSALGGESQPQHSRILQFWYGSRGETFYSCLAFYVYMRKTENTGKLKSHQVLFSSLSLSSRTVTPCRGTHCAPDHRAENNKSLNEETSRISTA